MREGERKGRGKGKGRGREGKGKPPLFCSSLRPQHIKYGEIFVFFFLVFHSVITNLKNRRLSLIR